MEVLLVLELLTSVALWNAVATESDVPLRKFRSSVIMQ